MAFFSFFFCTTDRQFISFVILLENVYFSCIYWISTTRNIFIRHIPAQHNDIIYLFSVIRCFLSTFTPKTRIGIRIEYVNCADVDAFNVKTKPNFLLHYWCSVLVPYAWFKRNKFNRKSNVQQNPNHQHFFFCFFFRFDFSECLSMLLLLYLFIWYWASHQYFICNTKPKYTYSYCTFLLLWFWSNKFALFSPLCRC